MKSTKTMFALAMALLAPSVLAQGGPPVVKVNVINDEASPVPVTIQDGGQALVEYRVVGFTTTETTGKIETTDDAGNLLIGYSAMHQLCAREVAPNARAAFSAEYLRTPHQLGDASTAWLVPTQAVPLFLPDATNPDLDWVAFDPATQSNVTTRGSNPGAALVKLDCNTYQADDCPTTGSAGGALRGYVVHLSCCNEVPVACAAPVAIPVTP